MSISFEEHESELRIKMRDAEKNALESCMERLRDAAKGWGAKASDIESKTEHYSLVALVEKTIYARGIRDAKAEPLPDLLGRILQREFLSKMSEVAGDYEDRPLGIWIDTQGKSQADWPHLKSRQISEINELSELLKVWGVLENGRWRIVPLYQWQAQFDSKGESEQ